MKSRQKKFTLSIAQRIALSFFIVIMIGSILLSLPISQLESSQATYLDHLFAAVSMVCVTGLFTHPVVQTYNLLGQIIIILLIQIGGLGLMTIMAAIIITLGKRVTHTDLLAVSEAINKEGLGNLKSYLLRMVKTTFIIEGLGAVLLTFRMIPRFGLGQGIFNSIFLAVSAFCNAGFDNFSSISLVEYVHDPLVSLTISSLLIFGGLGFAVWFDLFNTVKSSVKERKSLKVLTKGLKLHTKIVLQMTTGLLIFGTFVVMLIEYNNPASLGTYTFPQKLLASYFQSATMRTAGFATMDFTTFRSTSLIMYVGLMFIGGSPGGTAGGIKTTTIRLVQLFVKGEIFQTEHVNVNHHTVDRSLIRKALTVFIVYSLVLLVGVILLSLLHPEISALFLLFEAISALGTVGVSAGLTPMLSSWAHIVLMLLMYGGRIGPLTLYLSLSGRTNKKNNQYAKANILIG